ncbi:MAG: ThuA domain-containing protein, partial [Gemmatimonadetes bacterium]|nr:ThuA domain-containing protein [Gemmatimonadota bacterium]
TGGYYENLFSVNPIWDASFERMPNHPIARGVQPFTTRDEWYFNIQFRPGMTGITPILQATPSDAVRDGPYVSPRGPYPHIQAAKGHAETMAWAVQRPDGGRGFGYTGGHFHANWGNENARKLVLNALLWVSGVEVPAGGVNCAVTPEDLTRNLDPKPPR